MKLPTFTSAVCTAALAASILAGCSSAPAPAETPSGTIQETTAQASVPEGTAAPADAPGQNPAGMSSQEYVEAMGHGWNLGNSFDGVSTDENEEDAGETAWGNPAVTRELIRAVKAKGFDSIRIPMTLFRRYDPQDQNYTIDQDWLTRYKQVVDWAVEEDMYVMVNIHHDSWIWLKDWDGDTNSQEYVRFVKLWEQLADFLKDEPEQVCFETINEPDFEGTDEEKQKKLDSINLAAYHAIRESGGINDSRMIVMPTLSTNFEKSAPLLTLIESLNDDHIIATVHYYSEWVYSANLGITGFDEVIDENDGQKTPRTAADYAMSAIYDTFTKNGIGVVIGEYGLLGYDKGEKCNQPGEELKYYEYMNHLAETYGLCLMFWDNGSGIDRTDSEYLWKKPLAGEMLEISMKGRSSYATGLDRLYFEKEAQEDVVIPLTLNGNTFTGIQGLTQGEDYTYDSQSETVTLKADYINQIFSAQKDFGVMEELVFQFDSGAGWHEKLVKFSSPLFQEASGTSKGLTIPADYRGSDLRRISAYSGEEHTGPHSGWWKYLENTQAFQIEDDSLVLKEDFFDQCAEGEVKLVIEFFDGQTTELKLVKDNDQVNVRPQN